MSEEIKWRSMFAAPRDGRWVLLDCDNGSNDCREDDAPWIRNVLLGRFNPIENYPWEVIERDGAFNHWAEGRVASWAPLPAFLMSETSLAANHQ